MTVRVLNVAEKPSVAKSLAEILSGGVYTVKSGSNRYCKNFCFESVLEGRRVEMVFTSVLGHLFSLDFERKTRWDETDPSALLTEEVKWFVPEGMKDVSRNLEQVGRGCSMLIIWTDCDREGENIGYQVSNLLRDQVKTTRRARFSGLSTYEVQRAVQSLGVLNLNESQAVCSRIEIDLRVGAAFTRLQTIRLRGEFEDKRLISYGSCQVPTLGFVCEREEAIEDFIEEDNWTLDAEVFSKDKKRAAMFHWARGKIFDDQYVSLKYESIKNQEMTVTKIEKKKVQKSRPYPLRTVELQKFFARKGGAISNSHELMKIAETLYTSGYISYPRTETDAFPESFNFQEPLNRLKQDKVLGEYAAKLSPSPPPKGKNNDQAHSPIYPMKDGSLLKGKERAIYEYIARRFLAGYSKNAEGEEELIECTVLEEVFTKKTLAVTAKNYLEVFIYETWGDKDTRSLGLKHGDVVTWSPAIKESHTETPSLLTEAELIAKMDANGIGTDATIHDHIQRIKEREYIEAIDKNSLKSTWIGRSLIKGYKKIGLEVSDSSLRKEFEVSLKKVCQGSLTPQRLIEKEVQMYAAIYKTFDENFAQFREEFALRKELPKPNETPKTKPKATPKTKETLFPPALPRCNENQSNRARPRQPPKQTYHEPPRKRSIEVLDDNSFVANLPPGTVICECNVASKVVTVKKEGPNKGKEFYNCTMGQCDFFQWEADVAAGRPRKKPQPVAPTRSYSSSSQFSHPSSYTNPPAVLDDDVKCTCGTAAKLLVSKTERNNNRSFFKCNKSYKPCTFFKWQDEV
ncbi:DNA topoisomerase III [Nematocida displodere]|uniref:DNA topoisomerase n=1 Tax=Nematocida displodere TaxID=1805483 RepID=A0A177EKW9_9MICR|nr:DNA topoisomerase III [Nematocida displodere]